MKLMGVKLKAVAAGFAVDLGGSLFVGVGLNVAAAMVCLVKQTPSHEAFLALRHGLPFLWVGLLGTTLCTVAGGFVAGYLGRPNAMPNALAMGVVSLVLALALSFARPGMTPHWKLAAGAVLTIPAAALGGWLAQRMSRRA